MTHSIPAADFQNWLSAMREAGVARSDNACAELIGVSPKSIVQFKRDGVQGTNARRTGLAMSAALNGLDPWGY